MHEFEEFEASKFVSRLLGKGDWKGFIDKVQVRSIPWASCCSYPAQPCCCYRVPALAVGEALAAT